MASSSSSFHNSSLPNLFSSPSQQKNTRLQWYDYSMVCMFADKKNTSSDSSKPAFQFGGNNVIFGGKKDAPVDSSKPFQFGPNNGIFGDKKDTPSESNKPFHFGATRAYLVTRRRQVVTAVILFSLVQITVFKHPMHHLFFLQLPKVLTHRVHLYFQ
ncbi:hypothetical protein ZEAMMB73_Zm00001d030485 [Zea mays]|uniref:Uncharacterized protein n=1 Tax=Zea mays TaxID=4577 RepID=A0A1D6KCJ6_MAIZE|nr:hypothetical protein ZEAMMB73_Zm00001d030485 [Zea mays]